MSLPADRPEGFPHIIKSTSSTNIHEVTSTNNLTIADGVATFLWDWDRIEFYRFFDLSISKFEVHYNAPDRVIKRVIITRCEKRVWVRG